MTKEEYNKLPYVVKSIFIDNKMKGDEYPCLHGWMPSMYKAGLRLFRFESLHDSGKVVAALLTPGMVIQEYSNGHWGFTTKQKYEAQRREKYEKEYPKYLDDEKV